MKTISHKTTISIANDLPNEYYSPMLAMVPRLFAVFIIALIAAGSVGNLAEAQDSNIQQSNVLNGRNLSSVKSLIPQANATNAEQLTSPQKNTLVPLSPARASGQPEVTKSNQPLDTESAKEAIRGDFIKHKSATAKAGNGKAASTSTGASGTKTIPELTDLKQSINEAGPSSSASKSSSLDDIQLQRPPIQSLVSVNNYLNPFQLDATSSSSLNLRQALLTGLERNLDLAISRTNTKQKQFAYFSSLGNFLPDPTFGFAEYFPTGRIGLPNGLASILGTATSSSALGGSSAGSSTGSSGTTSVYGTSTSGRNTETVRLHSPFEIMHAGIDFYAYRGGSILFGAQQSKHNYKAAKLQESASLSDTLLTVTQNYYNLVLAETLLQIRIQAVRTSDEQLRRNLDRFHSGLATNLDVLQSRTQLSRDRQNLVDQQINRRSAAINLADSIYMNLGVDYIPVELNVRKVRLIDPALNIADILQLAIDHRPELKQYEELRLAARKAIGIALANLQPTVLLSGNAYGIGPPSNVQALGLFTVNLNWRLKGFGTVDAFSTEQARWQARQANLQAQKELQTVLSQVRNSYLQILDKERNIEEASIEADSALEELRLAELRKENGLGLNLDIITAQRDYTQALVDKAQALINFDIAQAQLLHDTGLISVDALTSGRLLSKGN
jgi:outer membrane protein TolC